MRSSKDPWDVPNNKSLIICKQCTFPNPPENLVCEICEDSLIEKKKANNLQIVRTSIPSTLQNLKLSKLKQTAGKVFVSLAKVSEKAGSQSVVSNFSSPLYKHLRQPSNLLGMIIIGFGVSLWGNYLLSNLKIEGVKTEVAANAVASSSAPEGLFGYGGAPLHAPLASKGFFRLLEIDNPGLELRFTKPLNGDSSNNNGVKMLLNKEITVAFTNRPIKDKEFERAKLRNNIKLVQEKIGIDGLVFFGNSENPVSVISVQQISDVLTGKITNWNQIDPKADNLPIVPVVLENEDNWELGIQSSEIVPTAEFVQNQTQVIRKVISTPGAFSFSSASLVQNQSMIKDFALTIGDGKSIRGLIDGESNTKAFRNETYPMTRSIFLNYRADGDREEEAAKVVQKFVNSETGQAIIKRAGFVPLR